MSSKRNKRTTRNSKKCSSKQSEQLCMKVIDLGATISSCNASNHFGYSPFEVIIKVEPEISNLEPQPTNIQLVFEDGQQIDIENKKNNINFQTSPKMLFVNKMGQCKFTVKIDTYSMFHDNRAFKLVFNLKETATRHIIPCETKPFRLVKHRLEIVTEPDDTFYKDEGGRANCLRCKILLKDCNKHTVKNRDIPLIAKLVYEDMSIAQSSRDILEILTQNVELKKGQCIVDFRINEVSKNHNKRAFRVLYECKSNDALYHDISSCVTNKIMVKSKRTKKKNNQSISIDKKRKRKRENKKKNYNYTQYSSSDNDDNIINEQPHKKQKHDINNITPPHLSSTLPNNNNNNNNNSNNNNNNNNNNIHYVPPALTGILPSIRPGTLPRIGHDPPPFANLSKKNNPNITNNNNNNNNNNNDNNNNGGVLGHMFEWCKLAGWVMNRLEWTHCGYEYDEATHSIDTRRPLYRCSYCLKYRNDAGWGKHENWCQLKLALNEYQTRVKCLYNEWNYQINTINNKDNGQMISLDHQSSPPPQSQPQTQPPPLPNTYIFKNENNNNNNNNNNNINLPSNMNKISSVSRVRSSHGYDAYDKDKKFIGTFDDEGAFFDAEQFNEQYQPIFDQTQMLLRNQSDDYLFYNNIRNNIFDNK